MVRRDELCHEFRDSKNSSRRHQPAPAKPQPVRVRPTPASLPPPHTQPSRPPMLHRDSLAPNRSHRQQPQPVLLPERPTERHRPIMPNKPVPSHHLRHPPKHSATPLRPLQIIDKPTCLRGRFHPPQQRNDLLILQMMCHQRAHNDIHRLLRSILQSVPGHPRNPELLRSGLHCGTRCIRIQVDPRQLHSNVAPARPACNLPQQIAAATAHIDDVYRITQPTGQPLTVSQASVGR